MFKRVAAVVAVSAVAAVGAACSSSGESATPPAVPAKVSVVDSAPAEFVSKYPVGQAVIELADIPELSGVPASEMESLFEVTQDLAFHTCMVFDLADDPEVAVSMISEVIVESGMDPDDALLITAASISVVCPDALDDVPSSSKF